MADGFVSYSRDDAAMVDAVIERVGGHGLDLWIDRVGIPGGARWWEELTAAIVDCDTFVVFVTAASMTSRFVADEIEFAVQQHKPIVPLVDDDVTDPDRLHPALGEYQWISFRGDLDAVAEQAAWAIRQDHVWRRRHAELQRRAHEWERAEGDVLGPADLRRAEDWLRESDIETRSPTDIQRRFIAESRDSGHRSRNEERWRIGAAELRTVSRPLVAMLAIFAVISALPAVATASRAIAGFRRNVVIALEIVPSIINSVLVVLVAALFSIWIFIACRNVARSGVPLRPKEVVVGFFVPVIGLWRPLRSMRTLFTESGVQRWRGLLTAWWVAWVVTAASAVVLSHFKWWLVRPISETTFDLRFICSGRVDSPFVSDCYDGVGTPEMLLTFLDVARVAAAAMGIAVVIAVTRAQERRGVADASGTGRARVTGRAWLGATGAMVLIGVSAALLAAPIDPSPRPDGTQIWCGSVLKTVFTAPPVKSGHLFTDDGTVLVVENTEECTTEASGRFVYAGLALVAAAGAAWIAARDRRSSARSARGPQVDQGPPWAPPISPGQRPPPDRRG